MKLSTHNLLVCNKNTCINNEKNYPLIIKASKLNTVKSDFDEEKTKLFFDKMNKKALNEGCKDLNISKFDLEKIKEEQMQDKNVLEYLHNILFEVEIEEGNLVCANCGREYMIKRGIPDMVLKDDEI